MWKDERVKLLFRWSLVFTKDIFSAVDFFVATERLLLIALRAVNGT